MASKTVPALPSAQRTTACALSLGVVALVTFSGVDEQLRFAISIAPAATRTLAIELIEAAAVAERTHGIERRGVQEGGES